MSKQPGKSPAAPAAYRIYFAPEKASCEAAEPAAKPGKIFRRFRDPQPLLAYRQTVPLAELLGSENQNIPPADELWVLHLPDGLAAEQVESLHVWLGHKSQPPLAAESDELGLFWTPGRAIIESDPELLDAALAALTDFAFYEGQLQKLEAEIAERWPEVEADMPCVSKVDGGNEKVWPELYRKLEHQHRLGMRSTRVEHRAALLTRNRPREVRKLLARLIAGARVRTRFEHLNNHLAVRDGVYDQIGYRLADHRQLRASLIVEIVIVVLLVAEVGLSFFHAISGGE